MDNRKEIGQICKQAGEPVFEWNINSYCFLLDEEYYCYKSPHFHLSDSSWYLTLFPLRHFSSEPKRWIGVFLNRQDSGSPKIITYTLQIFSAFYNKTLTKTRIFDRSDARSGEPKFLEVKQYNSWLYRNIWPVIISCRINNYSFASPQETPDRVSCAIQRMIPDRVSCSVQTEVLDNVTDKENLKDAILLSERMKDLLHKGSDYDVTICVQNKEFRAHRSILSTRSPVFAMMLAHDNKENTGTISIKDCDPDTFDDFLLYVYSGRTENLTPSRALQIYYTAHKYDFPALKECCVRILKSSFSTASICDVILLAAKHDEKELLKAASEFFARNIEEILITVGWLRFLSENPVEANELYIKSIKFDLPRK